MEWKERHMVKCIKCTNSAHRIKVRDTTIDTYCEDHYIDDNIKPYVFITSLLIFLLLVISASAQDKQQQDKPSRASYPPRPLYLDMGQLPKRKRRFTMKQLKRIREKIFGDKRPSTGKNH